jgi:hypothetical protein
VVKIGSAQFPPPEITSTNFGRDLDVFRHPLLLEYIVSISPLIGHLQNRSWGYEVGIKKEARTIQEWVKGDPEGRDNLMVAMVEGCLRRKPDVLDTIAERARFLANSEVRAPSDKLTLPFMALVNDVFNDQTGEIIELPSDLPELPDVPDMPPQARFELETWMWADQKTCFTTRPEGLNERMVCVHPGEPVLSLEINLPLFIQHLMQLGADPRWWGLFFRENLPQGENNWVEIKPNLDGPELSIACLWWMLREVGTDRTQRDLANLPVPAKDLFSPEQINRIEVEALPENLRILMRSLDQQVKRDRI